MSGLIEKVKNAVSSDKSSQPEGTHGTHQSRTANAADPRIDSDRDHRARQDLGRTENLSTGTGAYNTTGSSTGAYGTDTRPFNTTDGPATKTDGPYKSNLMNKADPRIDSDRDHSRNMGANPHGTSGTGAHNVHSETTQFGSGTHGTHSQGLRSQGLGSEGYSSNIPEGTHGPHSSRVANAADPRIDSDLDRTRHTGENLTSGTHATHGTSGNTFGSSTIGSSNTHRGENLGTTGGAFGSSTTHRGENLGTSGETYGTTGHNTLGSSGHNTLGSSTTHRGENLGTSGETYGTSGHNALGSSGHNTLGSSTTHNTTGRHQGSSALGSGPAPNTAGPHKSDMMNKMDPRVDSNLDGSKTMGGDKTFSRSNETGSAYTHKDPTDAAQVPPSVLKKHIGEPVVQHDHHEHDHARRHSVSHQEQHRGL